VARNEAAFDCRESAQWTSEARLRGAPSIAHFFEG
jgi:hypothetical protein